MPLLAQVLGSGNQTLTASAAAKWGSPSGLTTLPLTISSCEFDFYTDGGKFPSGPLSTAEKTIQFHLGESKKRATNCPSGSGANADLPGGFGWLETSEESCTTTTDIYKDVNVGNAVPTECTAKYFRDLLNTTVQFPIFKTAIGQGNGGSYELLGYAAFFLTGYRFPGNPAEWQQESAVLPTNVCKNGSCIYGYFTKDLTPTAGTVGAGPYLGVTVVQMTE